MSSRSHDVLLQILPVWLSTITRTAASFCCRAIYVHEFATFRSHFFFSERYIELQKSRKSVNLIDAALDFHIMNYKHNIYKLASFDFCCSTNINGSISLIWTDTFDFVDPWLAKLKTTSSN